MGKIRDNNIELIKALRPALYNKLATYQPKQTFDLLSPKKQGDFPNLLNKRTNKLYYPSQDQEKHLIKKLNDKDIRIANLAVMLGMGLGFSSLVYLKMFSNFNPSLCIIEKDPEIFLHAVSCVDLTHIIKNPNIMILLDENHANMQTHLMDYILQGNNKMFCKAIQIIEEDYAISTDKDYYLNAIKALKGAAREALLHFGNDPEDSLIGIKNTFLNINPIIEYPGIKDMKDVYKGKPGVIVSTGPSLNKNLHLLEKIKDNVVIAAADASLEVMKNNNAPKPHFVTSLERVERTSKLFGNLEEKDFDDVFLAACPVVHPLSYELFKGEHIIVYRNFATFEWIDIDKGILDIGPSAGNMAFKILEYMGCDPIILIGQDLAYGDGDITHAKGNTYGEKEKAYMDEKKMLEVEGNYVDKIKTNLVWNTFRQYYNKDVSMFKGTVINATEGGAKISGTKIMSFQEAIDKYITDEKIDVINIAREHLKVPDEDTIEQQREKMLKKVNEGLEFCRNVTNLMVKINHQAMQFVTDYKDLTEDTSVDRVKEKDQFMNLQRELNSILSKDFYLILMHYVQSYLIKSLTDIYGAQQSIKEAPRARIMSAMHVIDMTSVMVGLIEKMIRTFEGMEEELKKKI